MKSKDVMDLLEEKEQIHRAEKQLLLQEIAKNKDLTDKINKFKELVKKRIERAGRDEEHYNKELHDQLRYLCYGKKVEGEILLSELDKIMNQPAPELEGNFIKE